MEQVYIGKGRALDPDKYFIIVVNQIGNGLSTSPHNTPAPAGMGNFPHVRIGDDVRAQHKFVTEQVRPDESRAGRRWLHGRAADVRMGRTLPRHGEARRAHRRDGENTVHDFLFTETLVEAITSDPGFNKGFYASSADVREGLLRHAKMWAVMGWSTEFFQKNRHKALGFSSLDDFIMNFMYGYFSVMDPNDLLCMAWKWQRGDVSRHTGGDLRVHCSRIKAKTFVMPMSSDMFFPPADCQAEWRLIPDAEFRPIANHRRPSRAIRRRSQCADAARSTPERVARDAEGLGAEAWGVERQSLAMLRFAQQRRTMQPRGLSTSGLPPTFSSSLCYDALAREYGG